MGTLLNNDNITKYAAPHVLEVDINAIQKCLDAAAEIAFVPIIKGGGFMNYAGLTDDLYVLITNVSEAKKEFKDGLNELEIEILIKDNLAEKLEKFNILGGKSKYGIENILTAVAITGDIVYTIKTALDDGFQPEDLKHSPTILSKLFELWMIKEEIAREGKDIQAQEFETTMLTLWGYVIRILNS